MQQRVKWLFIAFIWILHEQETFINGLPLNGTFSSSISNNYSTDSLTTSPNTQANHSESLKNKTTLLDSFQINTWHQPKNSQDTPYVNLVLLPVAGLVCFILMVSLRCCTWQREDQKFKDRGCSYDVTNFIILTQDDADYSDVDMRSDNLSNYDTVNSYISGVPKSPWRSHSAMPSFVSLQSRIDSQMYDTVTSYRSYLQSPQGRKTFNFDKRDIAENDKLVNGRQTPQRPRKIPGTRFSIVPALDNYIRLKSLNKSPSQPESPKLLRTASESPDTLSSNGSETGAVIPRRNKKSRVSFTEKNNHCGPSRRPRTSKMVDAQTQVDLRRTKKAPSSQKLNDAKHASKDSVASIHIKDENLRQGTVSHSDLPRVHKNKLVSVNAEVYSDQNSQSKQGQVKTSVDQCVGEGGDDLSSVPLDDRIAGVNEVSEGTQIDMDSECTPQSEPLERDCPEIRINIITNPCDEECTLEEDQSPPPVVSSLLCCPSIPPKTKSETDLLKNNNNNDSTENLCRRKSCDIIQKSLGKNAKISPIGVHRTKCFCDNNRKFSLGAISNDSSSIFKSKNFGNSLSSLKDVLSLRKTNRGQDCNFLQKSDFPEKMETV